MAADGLRLGNGVGEAIRAHGRETYPHECCGAMFGQHGEVIEVLPLPNTTEEGPRRRFLVRPSDYRAAEARAMSLGRELVGFYHSHPDAPARPSQFDLDHAWPSFFYVIVMVEGGAPSATTCWRLGSDRSRFDEVVLNDPGAVGARPAVAEPARPNR